MACSLRRRRSRGERRCSLACASTRTGTDRARAIASFRRCRAAPSAIFRSWLNHPSYDRFWQKMAAVRRRVRRRRHPGAHRHGVLLGRRNRCVVLLHAAPSSTMRSADHALLIGPFDERSVEQGASSAVRELDLDPVARIDADDARYEWFDHALEGAERPALLSANVNYAARRRERMAPRALARRRSKANRCASTSRPRRAARLMRWRRRSPPRRCPSPRPSIFGTAATRTGGPRGSSILTELQPREGALFVTRALRRAASTSRAGCAASSTSRSTSTTWTWS